MSNGPDLLADRWQGRLSIAGRSLHTTVSGPAAVAGFLPALAHLVAPDGDTAAVGQMKVWSGAEPHPLFTPGLLGPLRIGERGCGMAWAAPPALEVYDPERGIEVWGSPDAFDDAFMRGQPASTSIAAWLADDGAHVLHLGAVTFHGRAALLIGASGAGKSTTTLACALGGAGFIGDDFCVVETGGADGVTVHSLYASGKLTPAADERLGRPAFPTLGHTPEHKRVVLVTGSMEVVRRAPVASLVILRPPGVTGLDPTPVSPGTAIRALAATGIKTALGAIGAADWFSTACALARTVPAFEVGLTWELDRVVGAVRATVCRAST